MMKWLIPGKEEVLPLTPEHLDEKLFTDPYAALEGVKKELGRQFTMVVKMFHECAGLRTHYDRGKDRNLVYFELVVDHLRRQIINYLWKLSQHPLTDSQRPRLFSYTSMTDDIERIGDHITNILELARKMHFSEISFSAAAEHELQEIEALIVDNLDMTDTLLTHNDYAHVRHNQIMKIMEQEDQIDIKTKHAEENHLVRFHNRICSDEAGPAFVEYLAQLERVADHCQNLAGYIEKLEGEINT
jgi:phosphate:Na+ symporter